VGDGEDFGMWPVCQVARPVHALARWLEGRRNGGGRSVESLLITRPQCALITRVCRRGPRLGLGVRGRGGAAERKRNVLQLLQMK
jgi:hypothetical protein